MPNFGMNRPTADSEIYPISHNSPAPVIFAILVIVVLSGIFYIFSGSTTDTELTEKQISHIDSVQNLIINAPERSIIDRDKEEMEIILWTDSLQFVAEKIGRISVKRYYTNEDFLLDVKIVAYTGTEEHDSLSVEFVMGN
ncbi:MAG: hypothetical protein WD335_00265 [Candidatus Paceibacterota bacterium]